MCVCVCVRACVRACVCVCVCSEGSGGIVQICMPTPAIFVVSIHDTHHNLMLWKIPSILSIPFKSWYKAIDKGVIRTHYFNNNLILRTVSRRVYKVISSDLPRREPSKVIQWYGLIHETWFVLYARSSYYLTYMFIICPFLTLYWLVLVFNPGKTARTFPIPLRFLTLRHHVFRLWFHAWNLLNVSLSDSKKTDSSKDALSIGI